MLPILGGCLHVVSAEDEPDHHHGTRCSRKVMQFMPIIFTFMFLWFSPAGLTLYWLVSNVISIIQQTIIYRQLEKKGLHYTQPMRPIKMDDKRGGLPGRLLLQCPHPA